MRHLLRSSLAMAGALLCLPVGAVPQARHHMVACAPGYAGSSAQAQATMDDFAAMVATAAGWPAGSLSAEYQETEQAGLERIRDGSSDLAIVPLPLYLKYEQELGLRARLQVVEASGSPAETWSLVARAGSVSGPESLANWEIVGIPAYAPRFVRGPILEAWGELPDSTRITFNRRVLGSLRRAAGGEPLAVILDAAQTEALPTLPGAEALAVVATSPPLPAAVVATIGERMADADIEVLVAGLLAVDRDPALATVLETLRLVGFVPLDETALSQARRLYLAAR